MADDRAAPLAAINAFEATLRQSASLARENFDGRKKEAIELRRRIADHRTAIGGLCATAIADPDLQSAFRSHFSKLCAVIALHQANWPVITIDLENAEYLESIGGVRTGYASFFAWARTSLAVR